MPACSPIMIAPIPAFPAPAAIAAMPITRPISIGMLALRMAVSLRSIWPPAIWPVSWARMPMIWFGLELQECSGVDENVFLVACDRALRREGIDRGILDQKKFDGVGIDAGGDQYRLLVTAHHPFDLGVANEVDILRKHRLDRRAERRHDHRDESAKPPNGFARDGRMPCET